MAPRIFPRTSVTLPTGGAVLREPYARGLVCAFAPGLANGGLVDLVAGVPLTRLNSASLSTGGGTAGLVCGATGAAASLTCPTSLRLGRPLSIVVRFAALGPLADNNVMIFGVSHNNTDSSPWASYVLGLDSARWVRLTYNKAGSFAQATSPYGIPSPGVPITVVGVLGRDTALLAVGPDEGTVTADASAPDPTYGATALLGLGSADVPSRNPQVCVEYGLIYNRALVPAELKLFRDEPYHWLRPAAASQFALGAAAPAAVETVQAYVWGPL